MPNNYKKFGFIPRDNKSKHPIAMLSCLYDVNNKVPVNHIITKHFNERKVIEYHIRNIKQNSIVLFDRAYICSIKYIN